MKRIIIYSVCVAAILFLAVQPSFAQSEFEQSAAFQKLDLRAKKAWRDAMREGQKDKMLECFVKVDARLSQRQKNELAGTGFKPGSIVQRIVTGRVAAKDVPALANLNFVQVLQLAVPMNIKEDPGYRTYGAPRHRVTKQASKKKAAAAKTQEMKAEIKEEAEAGVHETPAMEPVQQIEGTSSVPIYQSPPITEETVPNKPPTSSEIPSDAPAIAPVDEKPTVVQPTVITPTQPVVERPKPQPQPAQQPAQQ